jgi:drug/metabolite transporter (DMT)-like permease
MRLPLSRLDGLLLGMTLIWGSNFAIIKAAMLEVPPSPFNTIRMLAASGLCVALILRQHDARIVLRRFDRPEWHRLLALAAVGHFSYQFLFINGVAKTSVANSSLIFGCTPVTVALLSALLGHDRVTRRQWNGVGISLAGVVLVVSQASQRGASLAGDALIFAAMLSWATYTVCSRPLLERHSPLIVTGVTMTIGSLCYALFGISAVRQLDWRAVSPTAWAALGYSAAFSLVVAYIIWYTAVQRVGSSRTSIYSNLVPIVAIGVAALLLGEPLTVRKLAGAAAVILGVILTRFAPASVSDVPLEA